MTAKQWWKKTYRLMRIIRREHIKSIPDLMCYGQSILKINGNGEVEHVPFNQFDLNLPKSKSERTQYIQELDPQLNLSELFRRNN